MAVHRKTQKSLGNYDAKFVGPFTMRQTIWMGIGLVPSCLVGYMQFTAGFDYGIIFCTVVLIMAIPLFLAFGEKITYEMKPEDFAKQYYIYRLQAPKVRLYKTETYDDILWKQKKKDEAKETKEKSSSKKRRKTKEETDSEVGEPKKKSGTRKGKFMVYEHKKNNSFLEYK